MSLTHGLGLRARCLSAPPGRREICSPGAPPAQLARLPAPTGSQNMSESSCAISAPKHDPRRQNREIARLVRISAPSCSRRITCLASSASTHPKTCGDTLSLFYAKHIQATAPTPLNLGLLATVPAPLLPPPTTTSHSLAAPHAFSERAGVLSLDVLHPRCMHPGLS